MRDFIDNKCLHAFWHDVYERYMPYTPAVKEYLEKEHEHFFGGIDTDKVCGVLCRGTDIKRLKPYGHWMQPDVTEMIAHVQKVMKYYSCQYVFLATEDKEIYQEFLKEFGEEKLIVTKTRMLDDTGEQYIIDAQCKENVDLYQNNLDYLSALYQLSKLNYFVAGNCTGTLVALIMRGGTFEYSYVYNQGRYKIDNKETLTDILGKLPR